MVTTPTADAQIKQTVRAEFERSPRVEASQVFVQVEDGIVTLRGTVAASTKWAAERIALGIPGVRAVANSLVARSPWTWDDTDIASAAAALEADASIPPGRIRICVTDRVVQLSGEVDDRFQQIAAELAVRQDAAVSDVRNFIVVKASTVSTVPVEAFNIFVHDERRRVALAGAARS
jgi:osmotically-inducible protein OsmY